MKYIKILGLVAVIVAISAYFLIFYVPDKDTDKTSIQTNEIQSQETLAKTKTKGPFAGTGSLSSLRDLNENIECTISYKPNEQAEVTEGTYFVSEGKIRGDFLVESPDLTGKILSSMIIDGEFLYSWTEIDGQAYGAKIAVSKLNEQSNNVNQPMSLDTDVKYNCKPWDNVDGSIFLPPSKVLFQDMNELQKAGMEYGTTYEAGEEMPVIPE